MEQLFQVDSTLVACYNIQQVLVPPSAEMSILYGYGYILEAVGMPPIF